MEWAGEPVVTKVAPEIAHIIHPGDTIIEVNGAIVHNKKDLYSSEGEIRLKLITSSIYSAPMVFCRASNDYSSASELKKPPESLSLTVKRGDILQILSTEGQTMQVEFYLIDF